MITFVENDTASTIKVSCINSKKAVIDLTGTTVKLQYWINEDVVKVKTMTISDYANGVAQYLFTPGELTPAGTLHFRTEITFADGKVLTSPTTYNIQIVKDLV